MRIVKLSESNQAIVIKNSVKIIAGGGIVIGPTDTVYGIFCDARNADAIKKIFAMKGRPRAKAFPVFVRDIAMARYYAYISDAKAKFLEKIWPGQVTAVFRHKEKLPKIFTGKKDTIGMRMPGHNFLHGLMAYFDFPLAQTSANISGKPPAKDIIELKGCFSKSKIKPDLMIDGGEITGQPSAVIDCIGAKPIILRTGIISVATLNKFWESLGH